jgi:hypothetical protein
MLSSAKAYGRCGMQFQVQRFSWKESGGVHQMSPQLLRAPALLDASGACEILNMLRGPLRFFSTSGRQRRSLTTLSAGSMQVLAPNIQVKRLESVPSITELELPHAGSNTGSAAADQGSITRVPVESVRVHLSMPAPTPGDRSVPHPPYSGRCEDGSMLRRFANEER